MNFYLKSIIYYIQSILELPLFKTLWSMIGAIGFFLIGMPSAAMYAFMALCVTDVVLGVGRSLYDGTFAWIRFLRGGMKYVAFGIAVIVARQMDVVIGDIIDVFQGLTTHMILFQYRMIGYLAIHEATSIIGKLEEMGVPIPSGMKQRIKEYQESLEKKVPEKAIIK